MTHIGGLEEIVREEIAERLPQAELATSEYGRQHFFCAGEPAELLRLRTVEHVYVRVLELQDVPPGAAWLEELRRVLVGIDFTPAVAVLARLKLLPSSPTFRVTVERLGQQEYRSPQIAAAAGAGIVAGMGWGVNLKGYDIDVRVDVRDETALVGVRLSEEALHKRSRVVHPRVTLNPTVAAAMVRLSRPAPGELVVDPMCGGGTLLTERHAHDPRVRLMGGDRFPEKVALARENLAAFGVPAQLVQWDAGRLSLADVSVDKFLCNPPWGRLVASREINQRLYPRFLRHVHRCLRPGGLLVMLTSERKLVQAFLREREEMRLVTSQRLNVGGLSPSLYVLEKRSLIEGTPY